MSRLIPDGKISRAVREAILLRHKLLTDGMPADEADRIVGQGLKAAWQDSSGSTRTEPWHSVCETCKDSGWVVVAPKYLESKRVAQLYGDGPHQAYLEKCDPCRWLTQERARRGPSEGGSQDDFVSAGQMKPRKRF